MEKTKTIKNWWNPTELESNDCFSPLNVMKIIKIIVIDVANTFGMNVYLTGLQNLVGLTADLILHRCLIREIKSYTDWNSGQLYYQSH